MDPFALSVWVAVSEVPSQQLLCSPLSPWESRGPLKSWALHKTNQAVSAVMHYWRGFIMDERKDKLCLDRSALVAC